MNGSRSSESRHIATRRHARERQEAIFGALINLSRATLGVGLDVCEPSQPPTERVVHRRVAIECAGGVAHAPKRVTNCTARAHEVPYAATTFTIRVTALARRRPRRSKSLAGDMLAAFKAVPDGSHSDMDDEVA